MEAHIVDILLLEDNLNDAELTIRALRKNNLSNNLVHVTDGEQALEYIFCTGQYLGANPSLHRPKLILADIQMPKVSGIEVLQVLKGNPLTASIPVVMLTSSKEDPDIKKCYELGVNSYIIKPVDFAGFAEAIKKLGFYWMLFNQPPV